LLNLISVAFAEGQTAASGSGGFGSGGIQMFILPVLILVIFYFLLIRPNQKKEKDRKKMIDAIQKGDRVITTAGIYGTVVNIKSEEGIVVLKIGEGAKVEFAKSAVQMKVS
jgi:preprotein translocase subunit YajC